MRSAASNVVGVGDKHRSAIEPERFNKWGAELPRTGIRYPEVGIEWGT